MSWGKGRRLTDKVRDGLQFVGDCDLLLAHRDADASEETPSAGHQKRYDEIGKAVSDSGYSGVWVGMVPVRMTEAWLLLDEAEIRRVAGRPRVSERPEFEQEFAKVLERIGSGGLSRRQAAKELNIGYATLKRLLEDQHQRNTKG